MRRLIGLAVAVALGALLVGSCGSGSSGFPTGTWTSIQDGSLGRMEYRSDGTWEFTVQTATVPEVISSGTYSSSGDTLTFETDVYCKGQGHERGTYSWTRANDTLTFTAKDDPCGDRVSVVERAWTLSE